MPHAIISLPKFQDEEEDVIPALWRGGASEFFATMIFVFIGTGAVTAAQASLGNTQIQVPPLTLIAIAHGFAIMVLVYAVGEVSGGHINPAVTWACLITNKISFIRALIYVIAQLGGAVAGSALLRSILSDDLINLGMGCHHIDTSKITIAQGFGAEVIFTFIFIFIVFATAISPFAGKMAPLSGGESEYGPGKLTPFAVGMTILILHCVGIPFTGASMNPARTFGPAIVHSCWDNHWVYWIGPLAGSTVAAFTAQIIFLSNPVAIAAMFRAQRTNQEGGSSQAPEVTESTNGQSVNLKEDDIPLEDQ